MEFNLLVDRMPTSSKKRLQELEWEDMLTSEWKMFTSLIQGEEYTVIPSVMDLKLHLDEMSRNSDVSLQRLSYNRSSRGVLGGIQIRTIPILSTFFCWRQHSILGIDYFSILFRCQQLKIC